MSSNHLDLISDLSTLPTDDEMLAANIFVSNARENRGGKGKSASIGYGSAEHCTYFQTPRLYAPFGVDNKKFESASFDIQRLLLTIKSDAKGAGDFVRLCKAMDAIVLKAAFENQLEWFGTQQKDYKSLEIVKDRFHALLEEREPYDPQMKIKLGDNVQIYSKVGLAKNQPAEKADSSALVEKSSVRGIIKFGPAWSTGGKFGLQVTVQQLLIIETGVVGKKRSLAFANNLINDDDEEDANTPAASDDGDENKENPTAE